MKSLCLLLVWLGLVAVGCDGGRPGPAAPEDRQPTSLAAVGPTARSGTVGTKLPDSLRVRVLDQHGAGLGDTEVEFRIVSGGGSMSPVRVRTQPNGTAAAAWTLGVEARQQHAAAFVAGLSSVEFMADALAGPPATVTVAPLALALAVGDTVRLAAEARDSHGNVLSVAVEWRSSDPAVATVNASGLVKAVQDGTVTITASAQAASGSAALTIVHTRAVVASVQLTPDSLLLSIGDTATFVVVVRDSTGSVLGGRAVEWSSSDPAVVAVDASGAVTALERGGATVTARSEGRSGSAYVLVVHPAAMSGIVLRVAAGQEHSCALNDAGAAFCWGANWGGQLGDGSTVDPRLFPVRVSGGLAFRALAAGSAHTCGLTAAGGIHCWGDNTYGQLGSGTTVASVAPVPVAAPPGVTFTTLASGDYHNCAITADGAAYCWGSQLAGELGSGVAVPAECMAIGVALPCSTRPVRVAGGGTWSRITAGHLFTCGVAADHTAWCWGMNSAGNLGTGDTQDRTTPAPVSGAFAFAAISAGAFHTCGISQDGTAICWGLGEQGQLGVGSQPLGSCTSTLGPFPCATTPLAVSANVSFRQLDAGFYHSCGVTVGSTLYCWGLNQGGQLAVAMTGPEQCQTAAGPLPCSRLAVTGGASFSEVAAGGYHSLGRAAGTFAWGANWYGQIGTGSSTDQAVPFRVSF
jgi:alpha-tubulin suppressor-like RCC1 family protein